MATHDYVIANGTGAAVRSDLNNALAAIVSNNSSSSEPGTTYAYQWWADTNANVLKLRNSANDGWITLRELDGTMLIEDGSASTPGLAFADDVNTGIFSPAADAVAFSTGGTERVRITSTGAIAIEGASNYGTSGQILTSNGNDAPTWQDAASGTSDKIEEGDTNVECVDTGSDGHILFDTDGSERARIDNSGRFLLGTNTSSGFASARAIINSAGSSATESGNLVLQRGEANGSISDGDAIGNLSFADESGYTYATISANADLAPGTDSPGRLVFSTTADGASSATERVRITHDGKLLVGTSSPIAASNENLAVVSGGNTQISLARNDTSVSSGNTISQIKVYGNDDNGTYQECARIGFEADGSHATGDKPTRMVFETTADGASSPTERLRIDKDGHVQIGANASNLCRLLFNGIGTRIENNTSNGHIDFYTNNAVRNRFLYNGQGTEFSNQSRVIPTTDNAVDLGNAGGRWTSVFAVNGTIQTSDSRLKHEVETSVLGINFVKALRPVSYKWIESKKVPIVDGTDENGENIYRTDDDGNWVYESRDGARRHWGFIAQEVKQAVDDANVEFAGWSLADKDDPDSTQSLRYDEFIAPLTKALQEAIAKIETLETQNADLLARVTALEAG